MKPTEETQRQRRACERYLDTPPHERSLRLLAEELDIPTRTLERWSATWNWRHRAMMRDAQVVETHETLADHDLKQRCHDGLLKQVDEGLRDLVAGRRGQRSGAELAAMLRSALHADDVDKNAPCASTSQDTDWTRITAEEAEWFERTLATCRGDAPRPDEDATIRDLRQRRAQIYAIVGDYLRGHSDTDARGALALFGQARQIEKKLAKLGRPSDKHAAELDFSKLSDADLDRVGELIRKVKGEAT